MEYIVSILKPDTSFIFNQLLIVALAAAVIFFLVLITIFLKPQKNSSKAIFFLLISIVIITTTVYIIIGTVTLIQSSPTKGPVHWHADFRIFNCGTELNLLDPDGLSNKIGTALVHEHGDNRVHIEGISETENTASLENFWSAIGGFLDNNMMRIPTNGGIIEMKNGNLCEGREAVLQAFLWSTENTVATQKKLSLFADYIISPYALVPPGDCVIFEFGAPKERTEYICEQYTIAKVRGDITIKSLNPIP
ncbi:MAG: hypothetical protein HYT93_04220 [Parcubacteria group bacterium]|nr:hypothetical protein [Parcubacteria group bacterium]